MSDAAFQAHWRELAARWGLELEAPFRVRLERVELEVPVLLKGFGGPRGMLLVTRWGSIAPVAEALVEEGYGVSCLSASEGPRSREEDVALMEMLRDWGWSGAGPPPSWYLGDPA